MKESILKVRKVVTELDIDNIQGAVQKCLDEGIPAWEIIKDGISLTSNKS